MASNPKFEPLPGARFGVQQIGGIETVVIKASKNWFVLPFITIWLIMWTFGGFTAIAQAINGDAGARLFLIIWLFFWAIGMVFAGGMVLWQIGGRTMLSVQSGALVYRWQMPLIGRTKHYDASQIRSLAGANPLGMFAAFAMMRFDYPPFVPLQAGSIKFDYGARTIKLVPGLDEAEGRMIVDILAPRLPASAVSA